MDKANRVYEAACRLVLLSIANAVRWPLEQPARSIFWLTKFWQSVLDMVTPIFITFQSCMFEGQRPKKTTLAGDIEELQELQCERDGQHIHLPWGPRRVLLHQLRQCIHCNFASNGQPPLSDRVLTKDWNIATSTLPAHPNKCARAAAFKQTRKSLAFMPECHVDTVVLPQMPDFAIGTKLPKESQRVRVQRAHHSTVCPNPQDYRPCHKATPKGGKKGNLVSASSQKGVEVAYGVPWSPEGFISEARRRGHPAHIFEGLASGMKRAIVHNAKLKCEKERPGLGSGQTEPLP